MGPVHTYTLRSKKEEVLHKIRPVQLHTVNHVRGAGKEGECVKAQSFVRGGLGGKIVQLWRNPFLQGRPRWTVVSIILWG
jgi:hypothetical protein